MSYLSYVEDLGAYGEAAPAPASARTATAGPVRKARPSVRLTATEKDPPDTTLYVDIVLGGEGPARPMTGIFVPQGYRPQPAVDVLLYLHGHHKGRPELTIRQYWQRRIDPTADLRERLDQTRKNVILVAPTLGPTSGAGRLVRPGGFGWYVDQVLAALGKFGPHRGSVPRLGSLVLACHSGGGWPMRVLATSKDPVAAHVRECWGFDCLYNRGDEDAWAGWARSHPDAKLYIHYGSGGTAKKSLALKAMGVPNVFVEGSTRLRHGLVPQVHWKERLSAARFLADL